MNNRIKEIALECHPPYGNFDHQKFAHLIVKDIVDIMSDPINYNKAVYTTFDAGLAKSVIHEIVAKVSEHFKDTE